MAKIATKVKSVQGVEFRFEDKSKTVLACQLDELNEDIVRELAVHGLAQKVGDAYSGADNPTEAIAAAREVWGNLTRGVFNGRSSGTGGIVAEAVARIKGISVEDAAAAIGGLDEDALDALKKNARVKAMIAVIKGERAAAKAGADGDDDLGI
jgi:hypothetical protein